jgi:hypothetical protein
MVDEIPLLATPLDAAGADSLVAVVEQRPD